MVAKSTLSWPNLWSLWSGRFGFGLFHLLAVHQILLRSPHIEGCLVWRQLWWMRWLRPSLWLDHWWRWGCEVSMLAQLVLSESWAAKADAYVGMKSCSMEWEQVSDYYILIHFSSLLNGFGVLLSTTVCWSWSRCNHSVTHSAKMMIQPGDQWLV